MPEINMPDLIEGAPDARVRMNGVIGREELLTLKETADRLRMTTDQVMGFVDDGLLLFINVGRGKLRPQYRFAPADIDQFEETRRTRREPMSCLSSRSRVRKTIVTMAGSKVIGLEELRRQRTDAKLRR
jgi:hypothetical protein